MAVLKVLFYLIVLILVLVLAYITTRMLGRGMNGRQQSGDMKILDRLAEQQAQVNSAPEQNGPVLGGMSL